MSWASPHAPALRSRLDAPPVIWSPSLAITVSLPTKGSSTIVPSSTRAALPSGARWGCRPGAHAALVDDLGELAADADTRAAACHTRARRSRDGRGIPMSPRWHEVQGASLYFSFSQPHERPHVAVRGAGWSCTVALDTFEVLARSGSPPSRTLRAVLDVLEENAGLAVTAFHETAGRGVRAAAGGLRAVLRGRGRRRGRDDRVAPRRRPLAASALRAGQISGPAVLGHGLTSARRGTSTFLKQGRNGHATARTRMADGSTGCRGRPPRPRRPSLPT